MGAVQCRMVLMAACSCRTQNEQMWGAIQTRVENDASDWVIPILLQGAARPQKRDLPAFLRR